MPREPLDIQMKNSMLMARISLAKTLSINISFFTSFDSMSSAKLKGADGLDDLDEVIDVSPDLKKGSSVPVKAKGAGSSVVIVDKQLDEVSEEDEDEYEESLDDEEEDATRESKEKSTFYFIYLF